MSEHVLNIFLDLFLSVITFGLYNLYVQAKQMDAVNHMIKQDKYGFWQWLFFTLVTLGLYHIYHEYKKSEDIEKACGKQQSMLPLVSLVLTVAGLFFVADAIQQSEINAYFGQISL